MNIHISISSFFFRQSSMIGYSKNVEQFDKILLTQATFDFLLSILFPFCYVYLAICFHFGIHHSNYFSNYFIMYGYPYFFYPISGIVRYGSSLATVSLTVERFCSIVFPFKKLDSIKSRLIPFTVVFSIGMGIPRFFEVNDARS